MQYITTVSYYATGSSAVTDLLSEYDSVALPEAGVEWRFLQDPDGVRALEYYMVENNHRHNTSHAIKRFIRMCEITHKKWYSHSVENDFIEAAREYVDSIVELKAETCWHYDNFEKPFIQKVISKFFFLVMHTRNHFHTRKLCENILGYTHEMGYYTNISRDEFYKYTKQFINHVFKRFKNSEYVIADQLLPPTNISDYFNYFDDDIKVIVVERDPRDLWLLSNRVYDTRVTPHNLEDWCKWYEITRRHRDMEEFDESRVLFVHFEDLIYRYEDIVHKIESFIGLRPEGHIKIKTKFNPMKSMINTNIVSRMPAFADEATYIEKKLSRYLYLFPDNAKSLLTDRSLKMF